MPPWPVSRGAGLTVRVYVDPSHPEQAFLIRESGKGLVVFIVLGVILPPLAWFVGRYV